MQKNYGADDYKNPLLVDFHDCLQLLSSACGIVDGNAFAV